MTKYKLLKNISWLFFDKVIRIIGGLFVGIWVARYLGPNDYGVLNYAVAYTGLFIVFINLGLDQIVVREIVKRYKLTKYILGTTFWLKTIGSVVSIISIYFSLQLVEVDELTKIVILIFSIGLLLQSTDGVNYFYQAQVLSKYVVIARNSAFILSSLLKIFLIIQNYSVIYFAMVGVLDIALYSIFLLLIYAKTGGNILQWRFSKRMAIQLLKYSWPLALSTFLIAIHMKIDQIMIGNILDIEQVGIYSVAVRLSEFWIFIPTILISTLMPYFVKIRETDNKLYYYRLSQLYSLMFWLGVFVGIFTLIFGKDIINLLYGEVYIGAYTALVINIWSGIFISQAVARGIWMISENLQIYRIYNNILSVATNITLNMILIPKYGISGAAFSSIISIGAGTWVYPLLFRRIRYSTFTMIMSIIPINLYKYRSKK